MWEKLIFLRSFDTTTSIKGQKLLLTMKRLLYRSTNE